MLQKLSKCEVKAAQCGNFMIYNLPATQILYEITFWQIQTVKIVIFSTFRGSEF